MQIFPIMTKALNFFQIKIVDAINLYRFYTCFYLAKQSLYDHSVGNTVGKQGNQNKAQANTTYKKIFTSLKLLGFNQAAAAKKHVEARIGAKKL